MGTAELAKEHGDQLPAARKAFGSVVGAMFFHGPLEFEPREKLWQLRDDAAKSLHGRPSLERCFFREINLTKSCPAGHTSLPAPSGHPRNQFSRHPFRKRVPRYTINTRSQSRSPRDPSSVRSASGELHCLFCRDRPPSSDTKDTFGFTTKPLTLHAPRQIIDFARVFEPEQPSMAQGNPPRVPQQGQGL